MQIIPAHFIDTRFKEHFEMLINRSVYQTRDEQLVYVESNRMGIIENQRMSRLVIGSEEVGLLTRERGE